jgi:hypothetical protein
MLMGVMMQSPVLYTDASLAELHVQRAALYKTLCSFATTDADDGLEDAISDTKQVCAVRLPDCCGRGAVPLPAAVCQLCGWSSPKWITYLGRS